MGYNNPYNLPPDDGNHANTSNTNPWESFGPFPSDFGDNMQIVFQDPEMEEDFLDFLTEVVEDEYLSRMQYLMNSIQSLYTILQEQMLNINQLIEELENYEAQVRDIVVSSEEEEEEDDQSQDNNEL